MKAETLLALYERVSDAPDAIARLRRFVLDLAVRGNLSGADRQGEGTFAEKATPTLANQSGDSKSKSSGGRQPQPQGHAPFVIPETWRWTTLGGSCEIVRGVTFPASAKSNDRFEGSLPCFRSGNIQERTIWGDFIYIPKDSLKNTNQLVKRGDVLISIANSYALVGKCSIVDELREEATFGAFLAAIRTDQLLPKFLQIFLSCEFSASSFRAGSAQTTNIANITFSTIKAHPLAVPPLAEQHRIVAKVDELMALLDRLEAARSAREATRDRLTTATLARLTAPDTDAQTLPTHARFALDALPVLTARADQIKQLRKTILDLAVRGKLTEQLPRDESASTLLENLRSAKENSPEASQRRSRNPSRRERSAAHEILLPESWELSDLGTIALKITDGAHQTPTYVDKGVPFVSVKDFSSGRLDLINTRKITEAEHQSLFRRCDPKKGDILIGRIGTLGKAVIVDTEEEFSLFVSVALIRFDHRFIQPQYLKCLLNSPLVEAEFDRIKIGGAMHTNKLNLGDLHAVRLPIPPLAEQGRIVAKVDELMALCDRLEAALQAADRTRARLLEALLHEALTSDSPERKAA